MKTKILLRVIFFPMVFLFIQGLSAQAPFITTWDTTLTGSNRYQIFAYIEGDYDFYWEYVSDPSINGSGTSSGNLTLNLPKAGVFELHLTPTGANPFHQFYLDSSYSYESQKLIGVEQWGSVQWSSCEYMFATSENLEDIHATDLPDFSRGPSLKAMFLRSNIYQINRINEWDMSNIKNMKFMFQHAINFNQNISRWNTSKVEDMSYLFSFTSFNQPIHNWDVSNVTTIDGMFWQVETFNQPLNQWNTSKVTSMAGVFLGALSFNQPLNNWDVSKVTSMYQMFFYATSFNRPLDNWDVSNVTRMDEMFSQTPFNHYINGWDVSKVTSMSQMFFRSQFDQRLDQWSLTSLEHAGSMFTGEENQNGAYSCESYSRTLYGWANNPNTNSGVFLTIADGRYSPEVTEARDYLKNTLGWDFHGDSPGTCDLILEIEDNPVTEVVVYPNPSNGIIHISSTENINHIDVFDIYGKIVYRSHDNSTESFETINLSHLSSGIYFMRLKTFDNGNMITKKVVLE